MDLGALKGDAIAIFSLLSSTARPERLVKKEKIARKKTGIQRACKEIYHRSRKTQWIDFFPEKSLARKKIGASQREEDERKS